MHRLICLGALALLLSPLVAWSQDPPTIVPGSRIRITELEGRKSTGFVVTTGADTVVLRLEGGGDTVPFSLAWKNVSRLEMSRGFRRFSKRHIATGVGLGFLAGAAVGTLAVVGPKSGDVSDAAIAAVGFAVVLSAVGMVVGGVIGAIHQTERWEAVPSSRWHVSSWQTGSGSLAFALSARF